MPQYISDWICVATSGTSVDGRPIEESWLIESAETYSRETYTCLLWPYHEENIAYRQYTCNLGEVDALKYDRVDDKVKLYARLIPNQFLIEANQMGQKLFTSVEIMPDFTGTGKNYLIGLVVTDIPASLGTEKLSFTLNGETKEGTRGNIEAFTLGNLNTRESNKPSLFSRLFTARKNHSQQPENDPPESGEDATKMEELKALIEALGQRLEALEAKANGDTADTPEEAAEDVAEIAEEIAEAADEVAEIAADVAENPEDEVKAEEFTVAKKALAAAVKKFTTTKGKPVKRSRRQGRQKSTTATNDYAVLKGQLNEILQKFSVLEGRQTPLPGGAPAPGKKPFDFT